MRRRDTRKETLDAVHIFVSDLGITEQRLLAAAGVQDNTLRRLRAGKDALSGTLDAIWNWIAAERERRRALPPEHPEHLPPDGERRSQAEQGAAAKPGTPSDQQETQL